MLEADPERECVPEGLREWDAVKVTGDGSAELAREPKKDEFEIGEIRETQSAGSVTLLCIGGLVVG